MKLSLIYTEYIFKNKNRKTKPNLVCKGISIFKLGMDSKNLSRKHLIYDSEQVK